jgi:hypothetical protein
MTILFIKEVSLICRQVMNIKTINLGSVTGAEGTWADILLAKQCSRYRSLCKHGKLLTDLRYEDEIADDLIRAYDKVKFWKISDADLGLLFFLQYADRDKNTVSTNEDLNSEPLSSDSENEYTIEVNPWVNYKFGKSYFDFGLLFEFSTTVMENTSPRWNGSMGATENGVIRGSYPYEGGFSPSWEDFSQGSYNFFATGFEASTSVNIAGRFSALGSLLCCVNTVLSKRIRRFGCSSRQREICIQ